MSCGIFILFPNEVANKSFDDESTFAIFVNEITFTLQIVQVLKLFLLVLVFLTNSCTLVFL